MARRGQGDELQEQLTGAGQELYTAALTEGHIAYADRRLRTKKWTSALTLLIDVGLIKDYPDVKQYRPLDPALAHAAIVSPLAHQGAELIGRSAALSQTFADLATLYRASPVSTSDALIIELRGIERITQFIEQAVNDCKTEILTAQPYGKRDAESLQEVSPRELLALERGVSMRTLYQHSARQGSATREYAVAMSKHGARIRTVDDFFRRLLVFDRAIALIPGSADHVVAIAIREPSIVDYLVDIFERAWERGMDFGQHTSVSLDRINDDIRLATLRLLREGHSDTSSAKRLGVSARTYASYVAALKEEYAVETRFQLGWAMGRSEAGLPINVDAARARTPNEGDA